MNTVSIERLNSFFSYNPESGKLSWAVNRGKIKIGAEIKCKNHAGYLVVRVDNVLLRAHRIIWAMNTGSWPEYEIDHINGNRSDNRLINLRQATRGQNMKNTIKPITNKSGLKGVSWHAKGNFWQAHIKSDGVNYYLGHYYTKEEAHEAYKSASDRLHSFFGNHG